MAGKGGGKGKSAEDKLDSRIVCLKYTILSFNIVAWMMGASVFALCIWLKADPGIADWVDRLSLERVNRGLYVLIAASLVVMLVSFLGCCGTLMESNLAILLFIGTQVVGFILGLAGGAVLLDYSTQGSKLQPLVRDSMRRLIMDSGNERSAATLRTVQESIGCCGADGPRDYILLRKPLPTECRNAVTGNAYFYGCVDELTWFFEDKTSWICALTLALCGIQVINVVLSTILVQAFKVEESKYSYSPPSRT